MIKKMSIAAFSILLIFCFCISPLAATIATSPTSKFIDKGIVAADYDVSEGTILAPTSSLPSKYSSADEGYITDVRSQIGSTCWAYGSSATLESFYAKSNPFYFRNPYWFSPTHMHFWGTKQENGTGWQRGPYDSGYPYISRGYLTSWSGARTDEEFPTSVEYSDYDEYDSKAKPRVGVNSIIYLYTDDEETVKTAIYNYGAVAANYHSNGTYLNSNTYAYYCNTPGLTTAQLNGHCISVVGWDDNYSKENFNDFAQPNNDGAWLCKNSWGASWGNNGLFWISYEDFYLFDDRFGESFAITETRDMTSSTKLVQNEKYGATFDFNINDSQNLLDDKTYDDVTYANVFDISDGFTRVEAVNFESLSEDIKYEIYNIPLNDDDIPVSNENVWVKIAEGTLDYVGYHSIKLKDCLVNEGKICIGIKLEKDWDDSICIGCDEWLSASGAGMIFTPQTKRGDSFIIGARDYAMDLLDFYKEVLDDDIGSTFAIKLITSQNHPFGDANKDDKMNITDATTIQEYLASLCSFDKEQSIVADTNYDDKVSINDATTVQLMLASLIPTPNAN